MHAIETVGADSTSPSRWRPASGSACLPQICRPKPEPKRDLALQPLQARA